MMRLAVGGVVAALAVGTAGVLSSSSADAGPSARTIDRSLVCRTAYIGGARSITAKAHRGTGRSGAQWLRPAFAEVTSGETGSAFTLLDNALAWVTAGRPSRDGTVVQAPVPGVSYPFRAWGTLAWNARLCNETSKRAPLTAKGLGGGSVGPFDETYDCNTPARVRIRIHADLLAQATPGTYRQFVRITAPVARAQITVATDGGRPLAYSDVLGSGKARLLRATSCVPGG